MAISGVLGFVMGMNFAAPPKIVRVETPGEEGRPDRMGFSPDDGAVPVVSPRVPASRSTVDGPQAVEDLVENIRASEGERSRSQRLLATLVSLDTNESIEAVLELMEDEGFAVSGKAALFAEALRNADDERIAPAARNVLEKNVENGLDSWVYTHGYISLIARRGGPEEARYLLELLGSPNAQTVSAAAAGIGELRDQSLALDFIDAAKAHPDRADEIYDSLIRWGRPDLLDEMRVAAFDGDGDERGRYAAYRAWAKGAPVDQGVARLAADYRGATGTRDRLIILEGLRGLASRNRTDFLDSSEVTAVVSAALGDPDPEVQLAVLRVMSDHEEYLHEGDLSRLDLLVQSRDEEVAKAARRARTVLERR